MAKRPWLNCILVLGLVLSLTSCYQLPAPPDQSLSQPDSSRPEPAGTQPLTLAIYEGQSFHPILSDDQVNLTLTPLIYEGLFQLDTSFVAHNVLCDTYEVTPDGLVWTFTLRRDVTFSDGTPLTASHAVQSLELAQTRTSPYSGRFSCISSIAAQGDHQLVVTLSRPNTGLPALLDIPIVLDTGTHPLGTGPYMLTTNGEDELSLVPRTGAAATIPLTSVTRTRELTSAFARGDISLIRTDLTATDSPGYSGTYTTVDHDTTSLVYLGFHTARGPLASAGARRAVAAAVNRDVLVSTAWSGHARASALPVHPASPFYDESLVRRLPGPDTARTLVDQAGLTGRELTLIVNRENSSRVTAAQLIARQLEQAGLTVTVSALSWADYLSALADGRFDLYLSEVSLTADFDLTSLLSSGGTLNYSRWHSSGGDRLLHSFLSAPEEGRQQAASRLCSLLTQQVPMVPLCFKRGSVLIRPDTDLELTPTRANIFFGMDQ